MLDYQAILNYLPFHKETYKIMKKLTLILGLFALTLFSCGKQDSRTHSKNYQSFSKLETDNALKKSQVENSLVQLQNAGMFQMNFGSLKQSLGNIDVANYVLENNTQIVLIETLNQEVKRKVYNKMIDDFNTLHTSNNEVLIQNYQSYADENCKKIYGCIGTVNNSEHNWRIIKFLPNPEKCSFEPTITMSNVMLYK